MENINKGGNRSLELFKHNSHIVCKWTLNLIMHLFVYFLLWKQTSMFIIFEKSMFKHDSLLLNQIFFTLLLHNNFSLNTQTLKFSVYLFRFLWKFTVTHRKSCVTIVVWWERQSCPPLFGNTSLLLSLFSFGNRLFVHCLRK